jgi:BTB/POZ domain
MFSFGNPQQTQMVIIDQVAYEDLVSVLEFAYKGEATIKSENYYRFLKAAKFLQLKGISRTEKLLPIAAPPTPPQESALPDISLETGILEPLESFEAFVKPEPKSPIKVTEAKEIPEKKNLKRKAQSLGKCFQENDVSPT